MAGGGFDDKSRGARAHLYEYKITSYFVCSCIIAATGGSLFGYDLGVSGKYNSLYMCQLEPESKFSLKI